MPTLLVHSDNPSAKTGAQGSGILTSRITKGIDSSVYGDMDAKIEAEV